MNKKAFFLCLYLFILSFCSMIAAVKLVATQPGWELFGIILFMLHFVVMGAIGIIMALKIRG